MKKLLILGAGIYQVPLIETAKKLGIYTIVSTIYGDYPGLALADKVYYHDTTDYTSILAIAKDENIDGVVTAGTDVAVITIGKVCDELGLTGLSFNAAKIASNKFLMKSRYEDFGVRTARFRKISFADSAPFSKLADLSFPLIFKSVDSSGSRGIIKVDSCEEFEHAKNIVRESTASDYFIAEEFIKGEEFGAQAFVKDGKVMFILPHGDYVFQGDTGVPIGHFAPYEISPDILEDVEYQLCKAVTAMELDNCAINADFILKNGQTYVLELGGRSGATCLAELVSIYYGYNYYEKIIRTALGEDVGFDTYKSVANASMLLRSDTDGIISRQQNNNPENPDIVDVQFDYNIGDEVSQFRVGPDRIGHVITKGKTLNAATEALNRALDNITIEVE